MNDNEKQILQHVINGVDLEILNYKCDYIGIQYSKANGYYFLNNKLHITYKGGSTGKSLDDCRLILRPLSDLTKEIDGHCYWLLIEDIEMRYFRLKNIEINKLCVKTYNNLLSHHFDVFGLIEKGLAIDINTI